MNSSYYLPLELRDKDLYKLATNLIDYTYDLCNDSRDNDPKLSNPLIKDLVINYTDIEAVNAFYNLFIYPIIGTRKSIDSIFSMIGDPGEILEWFDLGLQQYHYIVKYHEYKDTIDIARIIRLCKSLENERSRISVINSEICRMPLKWDYSIWDSEYYDNTEGILIEDVYVCFNITKRDYVYVPAWKFYQIRTNVYTDLIGILGSWNRYDQFVYDSTEHEFIKQTTYHRYKYSDKLNSIAFFNYNNPAGTSYSEYPEFPGLYTELNFENSDYVKDGLPRRNIPYFWDSSGNIEPFESLVDERAILRQSTLLDYLYNFEAPKRKYDYEDIYLRCGSNFESGVATLGYMETTYTDDTDIEIIENYNTYDYRMNLDGTYIIEISFYINESFSNTQHFGETTYVASTLYQSIKYVDV